jgi:hypothetical protein
MESKKFSLPVLWIYMPVWDGLGLWFVASSGDSLILRWCLSEQLFFLVLLSSLNL